MHESCCSQYSYGKLQSISASPPVLAFSLHSPLSVVPRCTNHSSSFSTEIKAVGTTGSESHTILERFMLLTRYDDNMMLEMNIKISLNFL